ncbi:MAG: preprotein translocase subunit SecY, partial [Clostridia bacterium]|nr:preprotein translocase subunit SecY [Clostridia bacterium]
VSPYITASIVIQLLTIAIPALERWSKDGENGRKKITALTRIITIALALVTAIGYTIYLNSSGMLVEKLVGFTGFFRGMIMVLCYCAGAALVMWMAEKINESGIGNGISMILFANIVAGTYTALTVLWNQAFGTGFNWVGLVCSIVCVLVFTAMIVLIVWMSDAERRIPIQYAKRVVGRKMYGGQNSHLPLKVNMAGVMPIIFANSIVAILPTIASFMPNTGFANFVNKWLGPNTWIYFGVFLVLLVAFAFFYVMISFNPVEVANNIKNNGGAIPGIRSGRPTIEFVKKVLNRVTLVGALLVAIIACFPMLISNVTNYFNPVAGMFAVLSFGGSSLMIVVGVALETVRDLEAQMSLRNYKGFLD